MSVPPFYYDLDCPGLPQCDQGHLSGSGHHLVHQQGQVSRLPLPILYLVLGPLVISLKPELFPLQDEVTDGLHPPSDIHLQSAKQT